jgi:hypothetical protein
MGRELIELSRAVWRILQRRPWLISLPIFYFYLVSGRLTQIIQEES